MSSLGKKKGSLETIFSFQDPAGKSKSQDQIKHLSLLKIAEDLLAAFTKHKT